MKKKKKLYLGTSFSNYRKPKIKENDPKRRERKKNYLYRRKIRTLSDFSETMKARRDWSEIFIVWREKKQLA